MGRYVPPDVEGTTSGNRLHGKHALGARASKPGALTVRFEMPFAVWCASCPRPTLIGQGVRFNAQKRRAGAYHSTPVWSFRMRHADCGGELEIRTDPRNTAYVVVEGGTRRDTGTGHDDDGELEGGRAILTDKERDALRASAFASLEKTIDDRERLKLASRRIDDLAEASARLWDDPYAQNQKLRRAFRAGRKAREQDAAAGEDLRDRMSLGIDLVPATEEDARRAALVDFAPEDADDVTGGRALAKPLFAVAPNQSQPKTRLKSDKEQAKRKSNLASQVMSNTRISQDPFLNDTRTGETRAPARLPGVKRKRAAIEDPSAPPKAAPEEATSAAQQGLVDYDSD